jgi:30S ribosomal protein S31
MGKGDRRSRRGKLFRGSHGKTRPQVVKKTGAATKAAARPKPPAS